MNEKNDITTTRQCYDYILDFFNQNNIDFIIIRGFKFLPEKMDTDIDLIIHPNSYNKFLDVCKLLKDRNLINHNKPVEYNYNNKRLYYHPLITSKHLVGKYYRFDTYSDLFFYKDGEGKSKNAILVNNLFKKYLFDNKIKVNNYFIPNPVYEIILLLYRNIYDKQGNWKAKHTNRILELIKNINDDEFNFVCNMCFKTDQNVLEYIKSNQFTKITKPEQKLNLFIIRKQGLKKEVVDDILNKIKSEGYIIIEKVLVTIGDKNKFYKKFYSNYNDYEDEITNINSNQCLGIITNIIENKNTGHLKGRIRKNYIDLYPPIGNIIHSSDSFEDCNKELDLLFQENITNFKNIGTYYSHHE